MLVRSVDWSRDDVVQVTFEASDGSNRQAEVDRATIGAYRSELREGRTIQVDVNACRATDGRQLLPLDRFRLLQELMVA